MKNILEFLLNLFIVKLQVMVKYFQNTEKYVEFTSVFNNFLHFHYFYLLITQV